MSPQYAQLILINWFNLLSGVGSRGPGRIKRDYTGWDFRWSFLNGMAA